MEKEELSFEEVIENYDQFLENMDKKRLDKIIKKLLEVYKPNEVAQILNIILNQ